MDKTKSRKIWHCIIAYRLGDKKKKGKRTAASMGTMRIKKYRKAVRSFSKYEVALIQ